LTIIEKILAKWSTFADIRNEVAYVHDTISAETVYIKLTKRLGTSTRTIIAEQGSLLVDGLFPVEQETGSIFYHAFDEGSPCILKFCDQYSREITFFNSVVKCCEESVEQVSFQHLVKIELVTFSEVLNEHHRSALKMKQFLNTLSSVPHGAKQLMCSYVRWFHEIWSALHAIHYAGYAHCDIKPGNIFMDGGGVCYLGDYDGTQKLGSVIDRITELFVPREFTMFFGFKIFNCIKSY